MMSLLLVGTSVVPSQAIAQQVSTPPEPLVAIHVSEYTQALETMPAVAPTPTGAGTSGYQWWYTSWHYFVAYESLEEALRADGTPFVEVTDAQIASGVLLNADGSPRYPIVFSLDSEAINDNEIDPLLAYVSAGGFLFVGSTAFTRNPDGTTRGDFALADKMGLSMANPSLSNFYDNLHFTKTVDHRLTSHIPNGTLTWRMPVTSEEIPEGVSSTSPPHLLQGAHHAWQVNAGDALVIANGDSGPLLTVKNYGQGQFIYYGAFQPLIGHGDYDPGMYAYLILRKAIEWAFESDRLPIVKVSPWPYQYDAAFIVRHDFENDQSAIRSIESSAQFEHALGVKGDYFFCTGALREDMVGDPVAIAGLRSAVSNYGATIGSHNGGYKNPVNTSLSPTDFDYWHWGPDEALDTVQPGYPLASSPPGYSSGKSYAYESIKISFQDIEGWLAGLDNGRPGCGSGGTCPRLWAAPYFNSTRDDSDDILDQLGAAVAGEQKIGPFPHKTLSYKTPGKYYAPLTLPVSDWYAGTSIPTALEDLTVVSMQNAVDFYYGIGALINLYGHVPSSNTGSVEQEYVTYAASKPGLWKSNSIGIYDWSTARSNIAITPAYGMTGNIAAIGATITGSTDADSSVEIVMPNWSNWVQGNVRVLRDGAVADPGDYRLTDYGVKVRVGTSISSVEVRYNPVPLSSLSISPASVLGGSISEGTVTLTGAAPSGGVAVSLSSDTPSTVSVPTTVTVPAGSTSAAFTITTYPVAGSTSVTITADDGVNQNTAMLTVSPPALNSFSTSPTSVLGGSISEGTVTLTGAAPSGGVAVSLSSDTPSTVSVPTAVTVPAGSTSAAFTITTYPVAGSTSVIITVDHNGVTKTATLTVNPPVLSTLSVSPASVVGGINSQGTVTLNGAAPIGGVAISLSSDTPSVASVPTTVTVPAGSASAAFTITTYPVAGSTSVIITADHSGVTKTATLTVYPPVLSTLSVSPASVLGGIISHGTVTLSGQAPSGGVVVSLSSGTPSAASVPATITVQAGSASATFTVTTHPVAGSTPVTITADYGGITKTTTLTVTPSAVSSLSVSQNSVLSNDTSQGTVTLTGAAPSGGVAVSLSSNTPSAAGVPSTVTVPAGSISATFTITTYPVAGSTPVTISANYGSIMTATITVIPADGDLNDDNKVDMTDALKSLRIAAGLDPLTQPDLAHGDVAPLAGGQRHPDGKIDLSDVVAILRKAAGLPSW